MADPQRGSQATADASRELGYVLVQRGWLTPEQLRQAFDLQHSEGGSLDTCLLETGAITEGRLLEGLSQVYGMPAATAEDLRRAAETATGLLPAKVARLARAVPFRIVGGELWVALEDVSNLTLQDEISAVSGRRLRPHVATEARIAEALNALYAEPCSERLQALLERLNRPPTLWDGPATPPAASIPLTPEERARLAGPGLDPATARAQGPPPAIEEVERRLAQTAERDEIGRIILAYLAAVFRRAILFKVEPSGVSGWLGAGSGVSGERLGEFAAGFEQPSVFLNLRQGSGLHLGPLPPMPVHHQLARIWGGALPREAAVWPILVRGRMVVVLYGDRGKAGLAGLEVGGLKRLAAAGAHALELYLMRRKHRKA